MLSSDKSLSSGEFQARRDALVQAALAHPNHPMLHQPTRAVGETEMRLPDSVYLRGEAAQGHPFLSPTRKLYSVAGFIPKTAGDRWRRLSEIIQAGRNREEVEYLDQQHIEMAREHLGFNKIMKENGLAEISEEEALRLRAQKNMEILLGLNAHHFQVEENFLELLKPIMHKINHNEVMLPYEWSVFHLNYHTTDDQTKPPVMVIAHQDPETKALTSYTIDGELLVLENDPHLEEVMAVCVALDAEIIGKSCVAGDMKQPIKKSHVWRRTFKILRLKTAQKFIDNIHFVNTGRKGTALHFRRGHWVHRKTKVFWRRGSIVGKLEYGVVEKVYKV